MGRNGSGFIKRHLSERFAAPASEPLDLCDGDTVKIGEYTSIKVKIELIGADNRLQRNLRRRDVKINSGSVDENSELGLGVGGESGNAAEGAREKRKTRSRRGAMKDKLACIDEKSELGLGIGGELANPVEVPIEHRRTRSQSTRGRIVKSEPRESLCVVDNAEKSDDVCAIEPKQGHQTGANLASSDELGLGICKELGDAVEIAKENRKRQGRPRKCKVINSEAQDSLSGVDKAEKSKGVCPVEPKQGHQTSTRRTRSWKNIENCDIDENSCRELKTSVQITDKMARGRGNRKKKNLQVEQFVHVEYEVSEKRAVVIEPNIGQEREDCQQTEKSLLDEQLEVNGTNVLEDSGIMEHSNLRGQGDKGLGNASTSKESDVGAGDGPDLEKMTLGEWFDYLEVYLPKQIHDETEEMILRMNRMAKQFHEFILKQKNEKEKGVLPIG
ncbi:hypothetical protein NMG60_11003380 [Bertholletia excelsa]